jgi:hypothetical protein
MGDDPFDGAAEFPDDASIESIEEKPEDMLAFKTKLHGNILARLIDLRDLGKEAIEDHADDWQRIDEHMGMKVDITRQAIKGDGSVQPDKKEMPFERAFVVPVSFAVEKVLSTQIVSIFTGRDPITQFDGAGPEDVAGAKLMEAAAGYDLRRMRANLVIGSVTQSALRYGLAPVHSFWNEDMGWIMKPLLEGPMAQVISQMFPELARPVRQWGLKRAHVTWEPVDPYRFRIDPRKSVARFQKGDFIGHERVESYIYFTQRQLKNEDGAYFNVKELKSVGYDRDAARSMQLEEGMQGSFYEDSLSFPTEHLEVRLIPREWELGDSDRAEIWWFEWCGDAVIVRAHRSSYHHGEFSYAVGESLPDFHTVINAGFGEMVDPFQRFMNWMGSSHYENVRRFINNSALLMDRFIEMEDVLNPKPGGHVRLTQDAQDLVESGMVSDGRVFYPQLNLTDVTKGHIEEIQWMFQLVGRMTGVNDPSQGIELPSKRTATEINALTGAASARTQGIAQTLDDMLIGPLADQLSMIRQQMTTDTDWYRVGGDLAREIQRRLGDDPSKILTSTEGGIRALIAPHDLYGQYDYVPYSGTDPQNPARSVETMMKLMEIGQPFADPQMMMAMGEEEVLDMREMFTRVAENMRIKDIDRFWKPNPLIPPPMMGPEVVGDETMAAGMQAGNFVSPEAAM